MLFQPDFAQFQWEYTNTAAAPPTAATTLVGTTVITLPGLSYGTTQPGSNITLVASTTNIAYDVYGILICINGFAASNAIRNGRLRFLIGTNNTTADTNSVIINDLLMGSAAPNTVDFGGIWYYFPLFIKAGHSLWAQGINGTGANVNVGVAVWLYGRPKRPEVTRVGKYIDAFGINEAANAGTGITLGGAAEGNYTQLGSATTRPYWWAQMGFAYADASQTNAALHLDLAAGTSTTVNRRLIYDQLWVTNTTEQVSCRPYFGGMTGFDVPIGSNIYGRGQTSGVADTGPSIAAYLLGG